MRIADLDAVTVDAMGTLVELVSPVAPLRDALEASGVSRTEAEIEAAFRAEVRYYRPRSHLAAGDPELVALRQACTRVFLEHLGAAIDPARFADRFVASIVFRPAPGAIQGLQQLRRAGLGIAVVSNWDCSLPETLRSANLLALVDTVVTSAEVGAPKPATAAFERALQHLGSAPERTLHIGDEADDEQGARAAGLHFAPAPFAQAVAALA